MKKTKIIEFTYTKDNGDVSKRTGITLGYSSPKLALIADISDFTDDGEKLFLQEQLDEARKEYLKQVASILEDCGVEQKTFKLSGISDEKEILLGT